MFGAILSLLLLLMAGISSLPTPEDEYTAIIMDIRNKSTGLPDPKVGEKLAKWKPGQGKAEEQGSYFEGDILTPPRLTRNGAIDTRFRWPKGVIPYVITGSFSWEIRNAINSAIAQFHQQTCVRFRPATNSDVDYVSIENAATGCWAYLGRNGGRQQLNLQTPGCGSVGTIVHEMMHAVGFDHEQSRMDRDGYVSINWENIQPGLELWFQSRPSLTYDVPYDYRSVMHYSRGAFSKNGQDTIVPRQAGVILGQDDGLTGYDSAKIRAMYKCYGSVSYL